MKRGILETVVTIICFSILIGYQGEPLWLIPMIGLTIIFLGLGI